MTTDPQPPAPDEPPPGPLVPCAAVHPDDEWTVCTKPLLHRSGWTDHYSSKTRKRWKK